jgi:Domain of unknown function (DUF5666)
MNVRRLLVLSVVMMVALTACRRDENSITGSYGSGILAGQVVLNGIEGSPEGVEVTVRDTGMAATLGADGRFAFSGVPVMSTLDFRRGDGIQATLAVKGNSPAMIVVLGKSTATRGSRGGNKTKDKREFEGIIQAASATEITLLTSKKEEILIGLSEETVIRKGGTTLEPANLKADMRVHVRARKAGDAYTAQLIIVQEGEDDGGDGEDKPKLRQYEGTIVTASASELVIADSRQGEVKFAINGDTEIRKGNRTVAPADLLPGQRVHVKATVAEDGSATAVLIILQNTNDTVSASGTVLGVSGANITVKTKSAEVVVQTNATTRIRKKGKTIAVSEIVPGDTVSAKGKQVSPNTILASEVEVRGKSGQP